MNAVLRWKWPLLAALLVLLPHLLQGEYPRHLMILAMVFVMLAQGLNLTMGYVGYLPFGYLIFFAMGAYASALLSVNWGQSFWVGLAGAIGLTGVLAFFIGIPSLRLRGPYFAIVTLAFAEIGGLVLNNWVELTRGPMGIPGIPSPTIALPGMTPYRINGSVSWYYLMLVLAVLVTLVCQRLVQSRTGDAFLAIRENEDLAESVGVPTYRYKLLAFVVSAMIAGVAGSAYAHYVTIVSPDLESFYFVITTFTMVIIGGQGTLSGPIVGAVVFTILPELLRAAQLWRLVIFGVLMVAGIVFMPRGIVGWAEEQWQRLRREGRP
ncbi:MAG: branched-chain amino acid ABC transporter permease [Candidatus Lambdaproteobacteria bacterium]|nr:branched-chain amino acid ABC transporter permease [Candidatus Lambdaproteobacteria bacterium]